MSEILPIGKALSVDKEGKFINPCSQGNIVLPWSRAVEDVVASYRYYLKDKLHSVYVRGSVARGTAVEGVSDIDTFAVITGNRWEIDLSWADKVQKSISEKYPFQTGIEMQFVTDDEIFESKKANSIRFTIKTLSTCVWGQDISELIPSFKHGRYLAKSVYEFEKNTQGVMESLEKYHGKEEIKGICQWVMKSFVRTGFFLVMEREQTFSRDLYPCYSAFSKYYTEKSEQMKLAFEWAINPTDDKEELTKFIASFGAWISSEIEHVFEPATC